MTDHRVTITASPEALAVAERNRKAEAFVRSERRPRCTCHHSAEAHFRAGTNEADEWAPVFGEGGCHDESREGLFCPCREYEAEVNP